MHEGEDMAPKSVELRETDAGLTLVGDNMELRCDFEEMLPRIKPGRLQQELLVKAARVKQMRPFDSPLPPSTALPALAKIPFCSPQQASRCACSSATKPSRRFWKMAFRGLVITRWYLA